MLDLVLNFSSEFDPGINQIAGIVRFAIRAGENVTCTFTNTFTAPEPELGSLAISGIVKLQQINPRGS